MAHRYVNSTKFDAWIGAIKVPPDDEVAFAAKEDEVYECIDLGYVGGEFFRESQGHRLWWKLVKPELNSERRNRWTADEIKQIALDEGIHLPLSRLTISTIQSGPDGLTREQIVAGLRMFADVPDDDGSERWKPNFLLTE